MTVHVLRGRVGYDVASPLEWTAVDGSGEGVVHDEWYAVAVGHLGKALNVEHVAARVGDGLAEEALRILLEASLYLLVRPFRVNEGTLYAEFLHCHAEEVERAAVDGV